MTVPHPRCVFDAEQDSPAIVAALQPACPGLHGAMLRLRTTLPLDVHCAEHMAPDWYRLPRHYRSFCRPLEGQGKYVSFLDAPAAVFKGAEHLLPDFPAYLQWMLRAQFRGSELPMGLHLPLKLRMPPGAMPLDEALREQTIATELHARHLGAYGALAHAPVPLFVFRTGDAVESRYLDLLRQHLPLPAFDRVEARVRGGLSVSVSFYPSAPVRLDNVTPTMDQTLGAYSRRALSDPDGLVRRWARLLARLLALGYMPYVPWNTGWGTCFDTGNACIDGGFTDLVTLTRFESIADERIFRASLVQTLDAFGETIGALCRQFAPPFGSRQESPLAHQYIGTFVRPLVEELFEEEAAALPVDSRIRAAFRIRTVRDLVLATEAISHRGGPYRVRGATP